jgi:hypothetical protein
MRRGFSRIGIALAVLFVLVLGGWGLADGFGRWDDAGRKQEQARCTLQADEQVKTGQRRGSVFYDLSDDRFPKEIGCDGPLYTVTIKEASDILTAGPWPERYELLRTHGVFVVWTGFIALVIWLFFYGIGWALSGFARE